MLANYIFVLFGFLADSAISAMFPVQFGNSGMYFVPCLGFYAMVLAIRKMERLDAFIMSLLFGMLYDFLFANTSFLYMIVFALLCFVLQFWRQQVNDSLIENIVLCLSTIFIRELIVYLYMTMSNQSEMDFNIWLANRMFLTLLLNGVLATIFVFISYLKEDYLHRKELKIRREERVSWLRRK